MKACLELISCRGWEQFVRNCSNGGNDFKIENVALNKADANWGRFRTAGYNSNQMNSLKKHATNG